MLDRAVQKALLQLGGRSSVIDACPVCGRAVTPAHERIKAWPGKYAHARCGTYVRRSHRRRHSKAGISG